MSEVTNSFPNTRFFFRYEKKDCSRLQLVDIQFLCAMGPPGGGRNPITPRFLRHFNVVNITTFDDDTMTRIFTTIVSYYFRVCACWSDPTVWLEVLAHKLETNGVLWLFSMQCVMHFACFLFVCLFVCFVFLISPQKRALFVIANKPVAILQWTTHLGIGHALLMLRKLVSPHNIHRLSFHSKRSSLRSTWAWAAHWWQPQWR